MKRVSYILIVFITLVPFLDGCSPATLTQDKISLTGTWFVKLDPDDVGTSEEWFSQAITDPIELPGSLQEQGYGNNVTFETVWIGDAGKDKLQTEPYLKYQKYLDPQNYKHPFWLTPDKYFKGVAWYQRQIDIPSRWADKRIVLSLERCHWETAVYIDDVTVGTDRSLATPHQYDLSHVEPGQHVLSIRVDNNMIVDVGENAHSVSDHTQSNWNGITGDIFLKASAPVFIENVKIYPDIQSKSANVVVALANNLPEHRPGTITLQASSIHSEKRQTLAAKKVDIEMTGNDVLEINYPMGETPLLWDEFEPNLYEMRIFLESDGLIDEQSVAFGMREFSTNGTRFEINGRPIFLRGTLDCCIFPKTGYPPTDPTEWMRIFEIIRRHGLNHMRFHSWCPPEAAFIAADREGIYLQVEVDAWANIGQGQPIDAFILEESRRIVDTYGNHPSFTMLAYGNEPGPHGGDAEVARDGFLGEFLRYWKEKDQRRVYTDAAGWPLLSENEYHNGFARIQMWGAGLSSKINAEPPETLFDLSQYSAPYEIPFVGHETGQWCVYPNFEEIPKYTGVLKPKNFEIFQDLLEDNHMAHQARDFLMASGKLQVLGYKADIEAALRTPGFAGFQLLDLHDFPGQGTALVGVLDPFWDSKPYISPEAFNRFCGETVPLARMEKRTYLTSEQFTADIEIAHFGKETIDDANVNWEITDAEGHVQAHGSFRRNLSLDNTQRVGSISFPLDTVPAAQKMNLEVTVIGYGQNDWDFWVYPDVVETDTEGIITTDTLTDEVETHLKKGATVLLELNGKIMEGKGAEVAIGFSSVFWNTAWTDMQAPHTLGILCDPQDELFDLFPSEYHSNWQWWDIITASQAMILDDFPNELAPSIQAIDTWFFARRLGLLFEARVGNGRLIVTSIDFDSDLENRPAARQLYASLIRYMTSDSFLPEQEINPELVKNLYR